MKVYCPQPGLDVRAKLPEDASAFDKGRRPALTSHAGSVAAWLLAAMAVLSLLGAIGLVLSQAVKQGDASRRAMSLRAEIDWRCRALIPRLQREHCAALVQERQPGDSASVQALVLEVRSAAVRP